MTAITDYEAIRSTAAVYPTGEFVLEIAGEQRAELVSFLLAKRSEFAQPGSVVESLVLREDASVAGHVAAYVEEERVLLIADQPIDVDITIIAKHRGLESVRVTDLSDSTAVVAVEGPVAWKIVQNFADEEIAGVLLGESCTATLPVSAQPATIIRTGTTAEYGYLVLAPNTDRGTLLEFLLTTATEFGGQRVGTEALQRAQAEVSHPLYPEQFDGLTVREAAALWMLSADRDDEFLGSDQLNKETAVRSLVAVNAVTSIPAAGTSVTSGDTEVGRIHHVLPSAGQPQGFALALLNAPFNVPGLELLADGVTLTTISRPSVDPVSWTEPIG
ncbi:aminomethyltransferase [Pseudarthrobacter sp. PvP004]|uniref:aminomethyltransferase family protein n=1 Tax=Pseudarthrobacter sp. PvP004 TaxID=2817850 RepID=UPI001AE6CA98|nr:aminomethyltransferase family protein [Pseudarthrobacter sp. PvP004]MBP2265550.1 aminomethyltransferase [Pseudarthrobacter sp. PvP004]